MDAAAARGAKASFKAALLIEPKAPYFATGRGSPQQATVSDTREITDNLRVIVADIRCALFADANWKVLDATEDLSAPTVIQPRFEQAKSAGVSLAELPRGPVITNPVWALRPTSDEVAKLYPPKARAEQVFGVATISCAVTAQGALDPCGVVSETPADYGFGEADVALSKLYRVKLQTADGSAVNGGVVRVPMSFGPPR